MQHRSTSSDQIASSEGFREAVFFTLFAVVAGFAVELLTGGSGISIPSWPANVMFLVAFAASILVLGLGMRANQTVSWLGGIPVGLSMIVGLALLSLIGGVLPQDPAPAGSVVARLRLNGVFSGWPFAFVSLLFLVNLGLSLVWKIVPFRLSNLQFILFHGGFWIALSCGLLGTADLKRLVLPLEEGSRSGVAYDMAAKTAVRLPYSLYLKDFQIDEYVPQLALYDPAADRVIEDKNRRIPEVRMGAHAEWPGIASVTVLEFMPDALPDREGNPVPAAERKGVPFARIRLETPGQPAVEGWINGGGPSTEPRFCPVGEKFVVIAPGPAKAYRSQVVITGDNGERRTATLEVNRPVDFQGWKLYQMGYDEKAGRWSTMSLVEAVRDPWLPAVYLGFFMIMAGNLLFFWKGVKKMEAA